MAWPVAGDDPRRACGAAMLEPNPGGGSNKYLPNGVSFKENRDWQRWWAPGRGGRLTLRFGLARGAPAVQH